MKPLLLLAAFASTMLAQAQPGYFVRNSKPGATIVLGQDAPPFHRVLADELNRYVGALSGASLEVMASSGTVPAAVTIAIGGPESNPLARQAADRGLVVFRGLKKDGYVLQQTELYGRSVVIAGGNDEAATMYAVYELIERLGATFLLTKDILPARAADLAVPVLPGRVETPFPRRGLFISNIYPSRGMMDLAEVKIMLDQMAKMKMNYLQFFWFEHEPWIDFTYNGEHKLLGDATGPETGYLTWRYHYGSHLVKDIPVGKELFRGKRKIAPAEFQEVETPAQAFITARAFLKEIIRYAKFRKIKVWLCIDPSTLPGNLARYARRATNLDIPFHPILATHMCPADPVLHEINESRFQALVETYPEADGYFLYLPEMFPNCPAEQDRNFLIGERGKYDGLLNLWAPFTAYERNPSVVLDSNIGSIHIARQIISARDRIAPQAKLGIGGIGRAFVLPFLDRIFAKDVPFTDMESSAIWTPTGVPMEDFGGMAERERTLVPRMDDDSAMFGMQFNVNLYYRDRVLLGSLENGVTGFAGQLNRPRGTEQNYLYLAQGSWNPKLTPAEFYASYARRIFGEDAAKDMEAAFRTLEENEEYLGWTGRSNFGCCGVIPEVALAYRLYKQPNPFDGPLNWEGFISRSHDQVRYFTRSVRLLNKAVLALDRAARHVSPQGREELNYLKNKTESYALLLETLVTARQGYIAFDNAFRLRKEPAGPAFVHRLDESLRLFTQASLLGRRTTTKFAEVIDHTSDLGVLYRANLFLVTGLELVEQTMTNINNFHHGRQYTKRVEWNRIYYDFPEFAPQR
ncbi:MAG: hypothetical protein IT163_15125 [Bryobacterales bacterium]|nr:hypothetical protein [Bryobacterales bacterium]